MKKLLTILLSILMVVTIGTVNVFADAKYKLVVTVDGTETEISALNFTDYTYKYNGEEVEDVDGIYTIADTLTGTCTEKEHTHTDVTGKCYEQVTAGDNQIFKEMSEVWGLYELDCDLPHTHTDVTGKCYEQVTAGDNQIIRKVSNVWGLYNYTTSCTNHDSTHSHSGITAISNSCYTKYTRQNKNKPWVPTIDDSLKSKLVDASGNPVSNSTTVAYLLTCGQHAHTEDCYSVVEGYNDLIADDGNYYKLDCNLPTTHDHTDDCYTTVIEPKLTKSGDNYYKLVCTEKEHTHDSTCNTVTVALTSAERQYTVKFFVDGELYATALTSSFKVTAPKENPEKVGFVFNGWFTEEKVEDQGEEEFDFDTEIKDNLDLYAGWYGSDKKIAMNNKDAKSIEASGTIYQLTTEEEKALKDKKDKKGNMSYIEFIVKGETASEEKLNNAAKGETMFVQEDVTITNHIWRTNKKGKVIGQEYRKALSVITPGYVELCVDIKDAGSAVNGYYRVWTVRTLHNGEVEEINNLKIDGNKLTFKADKFSVFSVSYKDVKKPSPSPKPTPKKVVYVAPKTGVEG